VLTYLHHNYGKGPHKVLAKVFVAIVYKAV
jgi:hypothetical protein